MSGFNNSHFIFDENKHSLAQNSVFKSIGEEWTGSCLPYDTATVQSSKHPFRGKRHVDESEQLEEIQLPWKKPASEEAVLKQLSSLNISNIGNLKMSVNDADMVTVEDVSDVESSDESVEKRLILPDVLRRGYKLLKTQGTLSDPDFLKMASSSVSTSPQYCLALVPYVPRPSLPPFPISDLAHPDSSPASSSDEVEDDGQDKKNVMVEPMDCAAEDLTPTVPHSLPFAFNPTFSFGQLNTSGKPTFVYEKTEPPEQPWQFRVIR